MAGPEPNTPRSRIARWAMVSMGLVCVGLGAVGAVVPGLPTTIFLILASYFFTRACPPLDTWLRSRTVFKPYNRYLDRSEPMPLHAVVWTLALIWLALAFSVYKLLPVFAPGLTIGGGVVLGLVASGAVVWYGRGSRPPSISG